MDNIICNHCNHANDCPDAFKSMESFYGICETFFIENHKDEYEQISSNSLIEKKEENNG